jgi:hypothetical protein
LLRFAFFARSHNIPSHPGRYIVRKEVALACDSPQLALGPARIVKTHISSKSGQILILTDSLLPQRGQLTISTRRSLRTDIDFLELLPQCISIVIKLFELFFR